MGPQVVPFYGLSLEPCNAIPKKELLRGLWVAPLDPTPILTTKGARRALKASTRANPEPSTLNPASLPSTTKPYFFVGSYYQPYYSMYKEP